MEHTTFKHRRTNLERIDKFISPHHFTDVNLRGKLYPKKAPLTKILHYAAPDRITYAEAVKHKFTPTSVGANFGPTWSTHWFRVEIDIPPSWEGREVTLRWNSESEAMVWQDGTPLQGLSGQNNRHDFTLSKCLKKSQCKQSLYIEMACNGLFGAGCNGMIEAPDPSRNYTLVTAEVAVFDRDAYNLLLDVQILHDMAKEIEGERGYQAMYTANKIINTCDTSDRSTFTRCRKMAQAFFSQKNGDSQHVIHAMGHAHIDSAWLWTYAETIRKCARSWSCTVRLMDEYEWFTFTCSQAQQYQWVKEHYPNLYEKIRHYVKAGRFVPVGGSWVEMDGNIPSGEAFVRQFLYGQRFFQQEFGITCREFWLPDTFGYSAQLPQIMKLCGMDRFLTQKLSWNLFNKFPHHTFYWSGIDSSRVLAHFPPGDNYCMEAKVKELLFTKDNFADKGRSSRSCFLFGYGDGGHGPSATMLESLQRMKDVDGLPRVEMSSPTEYFEQVEAESGGNELCTWRGELYLELHNGTYTTHAQVKRSNRRCEFLLHDMELFGTIAQILATGNKSGYRYPRAELDRVWKLFLLNQFHDVLPGSSIGLVYEDAHAYYKDVDGTTRKLLNIAASALQLQPVGEGTPVVFNTQAWERCEVVTLATSPGAAPSKKKKTSSGSEQTDENGNTIALVKAVSCGVSPVQTVSDLTPVKASKKGKLIELSNEHLTATLDSLGRVTRLCLRGSEWNAISESYPGNQLVLYEDIPLYWDAWDVMDYHLGTRKAVETVKQEARLVDQGPVRATVQVSFTLGSGSSVVQKISLDAGCPYIRFETQVQWHEAHKFLKVEFPTSITSPYASYEIQFGHLQRPTHYNTSWDSARYEVCSHKWADLSEYNYGLAVLNDCKYGFSTVDNVMRLSLLRSPKAPDATADMGEHTFTYALMPHTGSLQSAGVIQQAYNLNSPLVTLSSSSKLPSEGTEYFTLSSAQVVLETVKMAEDDDKSIILRLYEAFGGRADVTLSTCLPIKQAFHCNGLEVVDDAREVTVSGTPASLHLSFTPFQIISLCLKV